MPLAPIVLAALATADSCGVALRAGLSAALKPRELRVFTLRASIPDARGVARVPGAISCVGCGFVANESESADRVCRDGLRVGDFGVKVRPVVAGTRM